MELIFWWVYMNLSILYWFLFLESWLLGLKCLLKVAVVLGLDGKTDVLDDERLEEDLLLLWCEYTINLFWW